MTHRSVSVLAFDIYGTILDTSSITSGIKNHTRLDDEGAVQLSQLWRRYQLEYVAQVHPDYEPCSPNNNRYTWRLNSMGELTSPLA